MKKTYMPVLIAVMIISVFFLAGRATRSGGTGIEDMPFSRDDLLGLFPQMERPAGIEEGLYAVKGHEDELLGFVAFGPPAGTRIRGFAGPVPFLIAFDAQYRVRTVYMLPNEETPGYAAHTSHSLHGAWSGMPADEALELDVDTVSGATMTSSALIEGVSATLEQVTGALRKEARPGGVAGLWRKLPAALFLLAVLLYFFSGISSARARLCLKICSVMIPGVLAASLLSLPVFAVWIRGNFLLSRHWLLLAVAVPAVAIPLLKGRNFYCYNFCPYGAAQDLCGKLVKRKVRIGRPARRVLSAIRAALIITAFSVLAAGSAFDLSRIEPFSAFRWVHASWHSRAIAAVFLALAVFMHRPWCRICPTGGIIEGFRALRTRKSPEG